MAGIVGSYASFIFDEQAATAHYKRRLREILILGIKAWVNEAKSIIPVWSGASRAALTEIAGYVGIPVFGPGKGSGSAHSNNPVVADRTSLGAASETFDVETGGAKVFFRWKSSLFHLNVNERVNVNTAFPTHFNLIQPGPYNMRRRCNDAFRSATQAEMRRLRFDIKQFIKTRRLVIGG